MADDIGKQARTNTLIALAFMASIGVYAGVAYVVTTAPGPAAPGASSGLLVGCAALAIISAALGFFLRRVFFEWRGPRTAQRYFTAVLVGLACFEASTIWGLIATFQTREFAWVAGTAALSLACMAVTFPRREALNEYLASSPR